MSTQKKSSDLFRAWWEALKTSPSGMYLNRQSDILLGVCLFFCLVFVNAVAVYHQTLRLRDDSRAVVHTHEVLEALDDLLLTVKDAESEHRGFLVTGEAAYLKSYESAIAAAKDKIAEIKRLTENSMEEESHLPQLQTLLTSELNEMATGVTYRAKQGYDPAGLTALADQEAKAMDAFENEVQQLENYEQELLESEEETGISDFHWAVTTIVLATLAALTAFGVLIWRILRGYGPRGHWQEN